MRAQIFRILGGLLLLSLSGVASSDQVAISDFSQLFREVKDGDTYKFFQGGFDEGAFVTGFFRGVDSDDDGYIEYHRACSTPTCEYPTTERQESTWTEVSDFALFFSGNSLVDPFLMTGLEVLNSFAWDDGDRDVGLVYRIGSKVIPSIGQDCPYDYPEEGCGDSVLDAREWEVFEDYDFRTGNSYNTPGGFPAYYTEPVAPNPGGNVVYYNALLDDTSERSTSDQFLRVVRVPEPGTLALLSLGLLGMGLARRRKTSQ